MLRRPPTIELLDRPTPGQFLRHCVARNRPAVLRGVTETWPARHWSPDYFGDNFPSVAIRYEQWDGDESNNEPLDYIHRMKRLTGTMGAFVAEMRALTEPTRRLYCAQFPVFEAIPQLRQQVGPLESYMGLGGHYPERWLRRLPRALRTAIRSPALLWLGPAGVMTPLHFDSTNNLFVQLHGRKRWILLPPSKSMQVYFPCPDHPDSLLHFSPVDAERPDLRRFPRFEDATPVEIVIEPGEILFTPAGWWHQVRALDPSVSLNFFWLAPIANLPTLARYACAKWNRLIKRMVHRWRST